jgi:putative FmdB family regulatory protein
MPIYEYHCSDCDVTFSKLRSMSNADAPVDCERCQGHNVKRGLSRIARVMSANGGSNSGQTAGSGGCGHCGSHDCGSCHH